MLRTVVDTAEIQPEDFARIKKKWRHFLVGDESNHVNDPSVRTLLDSITQKAQDSLHAMNRNTDAPVLFGTEPVAETHDMGVQYGHLWNLAQAWGTYGTALYKDEALKKDILYAIEWLYTHYYGMAEIDGTGWRSVFLFNWWEWFVQVPGFLCDTLMVLGDALPRSAVFKYLLPFDYIRTVSRTGKARPYASSRSYATTEAAVLKEDPLLMLQCLEDLDVMLQPGDENGGVMKDYSFMTHGPHAMEGMYGTGLLIGRLAVTASILSGTKYAVTSEEYPDLFLWMEHTFRPVLHNGVMFAGVCGRAPEESLSCGRGVLYGALLLLGSFGDAEDAALKEIIHQNVRLENMREVIRTLNNICLAERLLAVMKEDVCVPVYERGMMRYKTDRAVQHRAGPHGKGYAVSLNMSSTRIGRYECINHNNMEGWYQGDGTLYVYTDLTDGLQDEFGSGFFPLRTPAPHGLPYADMHKLPGTTEDTRKREPASIQRYIMGGRDFVGGAELNAQYIAAAMDFEAYHHEEEDIQEDVGVGSGYPQIFSDLTARKSWFLFDDEVVAVGSAICTTNEYPVNTYIDNRALFLSKEQNAAAITADGILYKSDALHTELHLQPHWVHLGCFGGYYLPGGDAVLHVTEGERQFFELWLAHGAKPQNASYAYVMLPGRTAEETAAYSRDPDVDILHCSDTLHAVKEKKLGITAVVFWEPGTYGGISADIPCIVMLKEDRGELQIAVSEPTQKASAVRLTIDRTLSVQTADPRIAAAACRTAGTLLTFDFSDAEGETVRGTFFTPEHRF